MRSSLIRMGPKSVDMDLVSNGVFIRDRKEHTETHRRQGPCEDKAGSRLTLP